MGNSINSRAGADKRRLEGAVHTLQAEIDDMLHQAKGSEEKAKKAMVDAARLADELRAEQDHVSVQSKNKRSLETTMADMENRLISQWIRPDKHSSPVQWMARLKAGGWEDFAADLLP